MKKLITLIMLLNLNFLGHIKFAQAASCAATVDCGDGTSASCGYEVSGFDGLSEGLAICRTNTTHYSCVEEAVCTSFSSEKKSCQKQMVDLSTGKVVYNNYVTQFVCCKNGTAISTWSESSCN